MKYCLAFWPFHGIRGLKDGLSIANLLAKRDLAVIMDRHFPAIQFNAHFAKYRQEKGRAFQSAVRRLPICPQIPLKIRFFSVRV
jgi:hypothetical protein